VLLTPSKRQGSPVTIRRELRPDDAAAIQRLHAAIYGREHGVNATFADDVAETLSATLAAGWPERGGFWAVEEEGRLAGTLALTEESPSAARVRWFLLDPSLRGQGVGRRLLGELIAEADETGYGLLILDTFSELRTAAHLYRGHGFEVTDEREWTRWGPTLLLQRYERRRRVQ
jgi:GNAT superfamily N-acetyltransferase